MDDILTCPVCGDKLRNSHSNNKLLHPTGKTANYVERICSHGYNHIVSIWTDKETKQVDYLRFSLNSNYSRFLEVDFVNQKCRLLLMEECGYKHIDIDKMLEIDFNDLSKLKEKLQLYILFS